MCIVIPGKPKSKRRRHRSQSGRRSESGRDQSSRGQSFCDRPPPRYDTPCRGQECNLTEGRENPRNRERSGRRETRRYHSPSPEASPSPPPRRTSRVTWSHTDDREYREAPYSNEADRSRWPPHAPEVENILLPNGHTVRGHRYLGSEPGTLFVTEEGQEVIQAV